MKRERFTRQMLQKSDSSVYQPRTIYESGAAAADLADQSHMIYRSGVWAASLGNQPRLIYEFGADNLVIELHLELH